MGTGSRAGPPPAWSRGFVLRMLRESVPAPADRPGRASGYRPRHRPGLGERAPAARPHPHDGPAAAAPQPGAPGRGRTSARLAGRAAMDADRILTAVLHPPAEPADHPLAGWVQSRETAHLVAWAVCGIIPPALRSRAIRPRRAPRRRRTPALGRRPDGLLRPASPDARKRRPSRGTRTAPAPPEPLPRLLRPGPRRRGLGRAGAAHHAPGPGSARLHAAVDRGPHRRDGRRPPGRPVPLYDFVDALAADQHGELANLAYWAYWLGSTPPTQPDDAFLHRPEPTAWSPPHLFQRLAGSLHDAPGTVDLCVHSLHTLLHLHPWLPLADPASARHLRERAVELLDAGVLSPVSRRDIESVHYRLQQTN